MRIADWYRQEVPLGRGGMGEVWQAHDSRLDREAAIRFLVPHLAARGSALERFRREARVSAWLQHPGIAQIFDRGEQDGKPHLVMELISGRNLAGVLREQPSGLPVEQAVGLAAQVAAAPAPRLAPGGHSRGSRPSGVCAAQQGTCGSPGGCRSRRGAAQGSGPRPFRPGAPGPRSFWRCNTTSGVGHGGEAAVRARQKAVARTASEVRRVGRDAGTASFFTELEVGWVRGTRSRLVGARRHQGMAAPGQRGATTGSSGSLQRRWCGTATRRAGVRRIRGG
ncbi:hypothetical protein EH183_34005 [Streptomyces sp. CB01881]|nr:hypothetical protein C2142_33940 [Streptomyces sp. CB01881]TYC70805.1 hypothetical protein EH183_34005 [Streptomyces sp. CB01881]